MAIFPLIDSPCPYKDRLAKIMDGDVCRMCKREVHDLTAMSDSSRRAFLKSCRGEVCVSYGVAASTVAALGALAAAAAVAPPAAAQTDPTEQVVWIVVGGLKNPSKAELIDVELDKSVPELPIVFEPAQLSHSLINNVKDAKPATDAKHVERDQK